MKIARVFLDCDLRCAFQGIQKLLKDNDVDIRTLGKGDLFVFLNRQATVFKVLSGNSYLVYFNNQGKKIPLEALQYLPQHFGGTEFTFSRAIDKVIRDKVQGHRAREAS